MKISLNRVALNFILTGPPLLCKGEVSWCLDSHSQTSLAWVHPSLFIDVIRDTPFYYKPNLQANLDIKRRCFHIIKQTLAWRSGIPHIKQVTANLWGVRTEFKRQRGLKVTCAKMTFGCPVYFSSELARALGAGPKAVQRRRMSELREEAPAAPQQRFPPACKEFWRVRERAALCCWQRTGCGFSFSSHCLPVLPLSAGLIDSVVRQQEQLPYPRQGS